MRTLLVCFLFLSFTDWLRGAPIPFSPIVWNYSVAEYDAGIQNWAIAQDQRGIMYIGNNKGLLEFDGNNWKLHELPTKGIVRSVYIGNDGKIFVGSYEEFGYFERDSTNMLLYRSLKSEVKDFKFHNDEIWNILFVQDEIVFQSFGSMFFYNGHSVEGMRVSALPLNLFQVGNIFYSQQINGGLFTFADRRRKESISRDLLGNSDVIAGVPYENGVLLLTRNSGGFIYQEGQLKNWHTECDAELKRYTVNRAIVTKDSSYIIGTISNGIYAIDKTGHLLWNENTDGRLQNNTVLGLFLDADNNVWAALDEGIAYIQHNSLIYYYEPPYRKIGMIYDVSVDEDEAYIASNQGLYRIKEGRPELVSGLEEQAWFISKCGKQIFCGHNKGTFLIEGLKASLISNEKGGLCLKKIVVKDEPFLLEGNYGALGLYKMNAEGGWRYCGALRGFSHMVRNLEIDHQGNIWAEHLRKGLFRLKLSQDMENVEKISTYTELGGVKDCRFLLFKINGRVVFSNGEQFYTYEDMNDSIVSYKVMNEQLRELKDIHAVSQAVQNYYWFVNDRMAYLVRCETNEFSIRYRIPFSLFKNISIEERASIVYCKKKHSAYLCLNNALARIQADSSLLYIPSAKRSLWVSEMKVTNEWSGKNEILPLRMGTRIKSDWNTVSFSLCYPIYNDYNYKIRYRLDGWSDQWTADGRNLQKKYTRLPFGSYIFRAEVYNEGGVLSSTEFSFEIVRPWYLSCWLLVGYVLSGIGMLCVLQYAVYRFVKKKKDRVIEHERIAHLAEIERQEKKIIELEKDQLEADLRFKSKELSGVVMTNIAHQEFLDSLKKEIQRQKVSGQYTRKNLDKLLDLVNNNMVSDEENWAMFQTNFDRIHENFFRNLKLQYPDLTSSDLRFCALLRLNLPTKEIAKLLNISVRGVDAARYRLRKKLNLPQENSLMDFMINFK